MRFFERAVLSLVCCLALAASVQAELMTSETGGGQPFSNLQPSLALTEFVQSQGVYPSEGGGGNDLAFIGQVRRFAGNFAPGSFPRTEGQLLPIAQNTALFSLYGTTYGGDGETTFGMPDLGGRAVVHPNGSALRLGAKIGTNDVTLSQSQMPNHNHSLPVPLNVTGTAGGGQSFSNTQPSQALNHIIALTGIYPTEESGTGGQKFLGQVSLFGGNFAPGGWALAEGQLLAISQHDALFSLLGTTYGGDGETTFGLPDLRERTAVHAGSGGPYRLGEQMGSADVTLSEAQMPTHHHTYAPANALTGDAGGGAALSNMQPSLAINYIVATQGVFPSREGGAPDETFLGEVAMFAGNFAPRGWAFADGQLLPIAQNQALYSLLGTTYGGDGEVTFALPDLRGRALLHADGGAWSLGQFGGSESTFLTVANLPAHTHSVPVPEPSSLLLLSLGFSTATLVRWRRSVARFTS